MISRRRGIAALVLAFGLSACGSAPEQLVYGVQGGKAAPVAATSSGLPTDANTPPMLARIERRQASAKLHLVGRNETYMTWRSVDGVGVTVKDDIVVSTRGLGADLLSADVTGVAMALRSGKAATVQRAHRYLDGENQEQVSRLDCQIAPARAGAIAPGLFRMTEHCQGPDTAFVNEYWLNQTTGTIKRSRQWIGKVEGMILLVRP